jgi:acyl-coenzyme A thioesterase PaaI-like protein
VSTAKIGQWVEFRPTVIKTGKTLSFAQALVLADDKVCARANATFQSVA